MQSSVAFPSTKSYQFQEYVEFASFSFSKSYQFQEDVEFASFSYTKSYQFQEYVEFASFSFSKSYQFQQDVESLFSQYKIISGRCRVRQLFLCKIISVLSKMQSSLDFPVQNHIYFQEDVEFASFSYAKSISFMQSSLAFPMQNHISFRKMQSSLASPMQNHIRFSKMQSSLAFPSAKSYLVLGRCRVRQLFLCKIISVLAGCRNFSYTKSYQFWEHVEFASFSDAKSYQFQEDVEFASFSYSKSYQFQEVCRVRQLFLYKIISVLGRCRVRQIFRCKTILLLAGCRVRQLFQHKIISVLRCKSASQSSLAFPIQNHIGFQEDVEFASFSYRKIISVLGRCRVRQLFLSYQF